MMAPVRRSSHTATPTPVTTSSPSRPARRTRLHPAMSEAVRAIHTRHRRHLQTHGRTDAGRATR
ncbi:hypothetical protein [Gluconacetobacter diazotrophicus]|uniref:hypothetical protein n=1 Tax=Gluconacetobacter diazotrophicus TaxID=33996 RepID=UPI0011A3BFEF|nr:hypothetical protein [Gluconacetobacter diazotrophicus]